YCGPARCARIARSCSVQGAASRPYPCDACVAPAAAAFCDPFPYIESRYARETIAEIRSLGVALVTAIITQTGSWTGSPSSDYGTVHNRITPSRSCRVTDVTTRPLLTVGSCFPAMCFRPVRPAGLTSPDTLTVRAPLPFGFQSTTPFWNSRIQTPLLQAPVCGLPAALETG